MEDKKIHVEYLIVIESEDNFLANISTFNTLLLTNSDLKFKEGYIQHQDTDFGYKVQLDKIEGNKKAFHVYFTSDQSVDMNKFEDFLRTVKGVFYKISTDLHTLRDDISLEYSQRAYPQIHQIENLMRKLITKFMITNVGISWAENHIPKEVKSSRGNSKDNSKINYLYNLDFIQLSNILFKEYSPLSTDELLKKINKAQNLEELPLDKMKEYVPSSNWERYFSKIVECEAEYLKKRWESLYDLRNKIAHNNILNKQEFEKINKHIEEIRDKLDKAINSLDKITVSKEDKKVISSNMIIEEEINVFEDSSVSKRDLELKYLKSFLEIDEMVTKVIFKIKDDFLQTGDLPQNLKYKDSEIISMSYNEKMDWLERTGLMHDNALKDLISLRKIRNYIAHDSESIQKNAVIHALNMTKKLKRYLNSFFDF